MTIQGVSTPPPTPSPLPESAFINVPYTVQAPKGWDAAHEEYCEAAAVLMYGLYIRGDHRSVIPPDEADRLMGSIVAWERQTYPKLLDIPLDDMATVGAHFYPMVATVQPATLEDVKTAIASGRPVIIPVMTHGAPGGKKIAPNYGSLSVYHVIVITGYRGNTVYTNDAGFTQGQNWPYDWSILESAMDAQTAHMNQGRTMLTFSPA